jgi:ABC-type amino acid transport system permease subunit
MSKYKILSIPAVAYIEIIRGTPLLLQLFAFFYLMPEITGFDPGKYYSVLMALAINSSGYVAEIIRSGIQAVDKGQTEAARSLGLNPFQTMTRIIFPQAVRNILPTLGNEIVMVIKETSLASTFFVGDLMTAVVVVRTATYSTLEPLIVCGCIYFVCTFTLSKLIALYERRLSVRD